MTLSVLMYAMILATFVVLAGVLAVDAVRGLSQRFARRATDSAGSPQERSRAASARDRRVVPTR
jgi:hypothetical protein